MEVYSSFFESNIINNEINKENKEKGNSLITLLPNEIILSIFSFLTPKDLFNCEMVSRSWKILSNKESLWHVYLPILNLQIPSYQFQHVHLLAQGSSISFYKKQINQRINQALKVIEKNNFETIVSYKDKTDIALDMSYFDLLYNPPYSSEGIDYQVVKEKQVKSNHKRSVKECFDAYFILNQFGLEPIDKAEELAQMLRNVYEDKSAYQMLLKGSNKSDRLTPVALLGRS